MLEVMANALALFLCWLFGRAALHKFRFPRHYRQLVSAFLGGFSHSLPLVYLVAAIEAAIAVLVILPSGRAQGLAAAASLLSCYALMMGWHVLRGHGDLRCGCSGVSSALTIGPALILRNLVCATLALLAISVVAAFPRGVLAAAGSIGLALLLAVIYQLSEDLIARAQAMEEDV